MKRDYLILAIICSLMAGCANPGRDVVKGQAPGHATGAGSSFTGPANSAAPSTQKAKRTTVYQKAPAARRNSTVTTPDGQEFELVPVVRTAPAVEQPAAPAAPTNPAPSWISEETETTFGQHQDAAGIVKVAMAASRWSLMRWLGIICVLVCLGGLLWSHENPNGYPVVFWKVGACGVFFIIAADHPAWLLLLLLPLGFFAVQKLNLLRLP